MMTTPFPIQWSVSAYFGTEAVPTTGVPPSTVSISLPNVSAMNTMSELELEDDCRFRPTTENYVTIVSFCLIFCLSVVGNSVVVVVIVQQRTMRSITNIYLLNLAISDLMLSVVCMPPTLVSSVIYCWMFGDILCKLFAYLQPVVVTASAYTLAVIAFERYYAICRPLHSRIWQTRSHAYAMISLVWIISVLANFFMLFMFELQSYNVNGLTCAPRFEPIVHFAYQIYMTSVLLLIPLFLMIVLYGSVIHSLKMGMKMDIAAIVGSIFDAENSVDDFDDELCKPSIYQRFRSTIRFHGKRASDFVHNKSKSAGVSLKADPIRQTTRASSSCIEMKLASVVGTTAEQRLRSTHSEKAIVAKQRVIRMLIVIVIIFFCCWTPNYMWWLLLTAQDSFKAFDVWNSQLNTAITVLCYISSCANPITYCFLNQKFRTALLLSFGCHKSAIRRHHFHRVYSPPNDADDNVAAVYKADGDCAPAAAGKPKTNGVRPYCPPRSSSMVLRERARVYNNGGALLNKGHANDIPLLKAADDESAKEEMLGTSNRCQQNVLRAFVKNGAHKVFESNI
uniref:G-protein coupled receptors family 1 profile domain-containing protein n=1 Tax=Parascaris univalens TaxID=6257 RepID=A0A915AR34_PARUN